MAQQTHYPIWHISEDEDNFSFHTYNKHLIDKENNFLFL